MIKNIKILYFKFAIFFVCLINILIKYFYFIMYNGKILPKIEKLQTKENLLILLSILESNNNEKYSLFGENQELDFIKLINLFKILNENNINFIKIIYNNRKRIHKFLYDSEEIIKIDSYDLKPLLYNYFYLDLLINENSEIVNYSYQYDFLINLNKYNLNNNLKQIKKLLFSKIIIELIKNFEGCEEYEEGEENKLSKLTKENEEIINKNIYILTDINSNINENFLTNNKIDNIYAEIIEGLFKNKKLEDYEYSSNILEQLEIDSINLTETMKNKIFDIFNEEYINKYQIKDKQSLLNEKYINFYYILFKSILKNSIYIYQIPFLLKAKQKFLKIYKSNKNLLNEINENMKEKFKYIIKVFLYSDFSPNDKRIPENDLLKLKEILNYYNECKFQSKQEDIKIIQDIINFNKKIEYQEYLKDYEEAKEINPKIQIIKNYYNKEENSSEEKITQNINDWKTVEKLLKDKKYKKMKKGKKEYLFDIKNREALYKIYGHDIIDSFIKYFQEKIKNEDNAPTPCSPPSPSQHFENYELAIKEENKIEKPTRKNNDSSTKVTSNKENSANNHKSKLSEDLRNSLDKKEKNLDIDIVTKMLKNSSILIVFENKQFKYEEILYGEHNIKLSYSKFKMNFRNYYEGYKSQNILFENCKYFSLFLDDFEDRISKEFLLDYELKIKMKFKAKEYQENENNIYNISCIYSFYEPISNSEIRFKENNILNNRTNSNMTGFDYLILEINNEYYKNAKSNENKLNQNNQIKNRSNNKKSIKQNYYSVIDISQNTDELKIIDFIKIADKKNNYNGFIKQLKNGCYIICKNDNNLNIYDIYFNHLKEIKTSKNLITNICERINNDERGGKSSEIITCSISGIDKIDINFENFSHSIKSCNLLDYICLNFIEMKPTNHVVLTQEGIFHITDELFDENKRNENKINDKAYFGCIRINDNILAVTSNSIIPNGEDKLSFFNIKSKKLSNSIENYSFVLSPNGLAIMQKENNYINNYENKNKIDKILILCACKKYTEGQKNGILLVNGDLSNNKSINTPFYDTDDIEINCICPIDIINNTNGNYLKINEEYRKNIKITETEYFLVGGFDTAKREGVIQLYKVIFTDKIAETTIQFIQDIYIEENEKFEGFDQPVDSIIQSKISGNIIVGCYNQNIYMFTSPNLNYFLKADK